MSRAARSLKSHVPGHTILSRQRVLVIEPVGKDSQVAKLKLSKS